MLLAAVREARYEFVRQALTLLAGGFVIFGLIEYSRNTRYAAQLFDNVETLRFALPDTQVRLALNGLDDADLFVCLTAVLAFVGAINLGLLLAPEPQPRRAAQTLVWNQGLVAVAQLAAAAAVVLAASAWFGLDGDGRWFKAAAVAVLGVLVVAVAANVSVTAGTDLGAVVRVEGYRRRLRRLRFVLSVIQSRSRDGWWWRALVAVAGYFVVFLVLTVGAASVAVGFRSAELTSGASWTTVTFVVVSIAVVSGVVIAVSVGLEMLRVVGNFIGSPALRVAGRVALISFQIVPVVIAVRAATSTPLGHGSGVVFAAGWLVVVSPATLAVLTWRQGRLVRWLLPVDLALRWIVRRLGDGVGTQIESEVRALRRLDVMERLGAAARSSVGLSGASGLPEGATEVSANAVDSGHGDGQPSSCKPGFTTGRAAARRWMPVPLRILRALSASTTVVRQRPSTTLRPQDRPRR